MTDITAPYSIVADSPYIWVIFGGNGTDAAVWRGVGYVLPEAGRAGWRGMAGGGTQIRKGSSRKARLIARAGFHKRMESVRGAQTLLGRFLSIRARLEAEKS